MTARAASRSELPRAYLAIPLLFAAGVRAVYGWQYWHHVPFARAPVVDAEVYVYLAQTLRAGEWLNPELPYHSFLYPYFLALFPFPGLGANAAVIAAQLALGVLNTWLAMRIAHALWDAPWLSLATGIGFTLASPLLFFETKLYPEGIATTCVLLVLQQLVRPTRAWTLGLACGLLVLARSEASLLAAIGLHRVWNAEWPRAGRVRRLAGVIVPVILCLGVAAARNSLIARAFVPSPTAAGGLVFYFGNNPNADGGYGQPEGFAGSQGGILQESLLARRLAEEASGHALSLPDVDRYWWRRGVGYLAGNPGRTVALVGRKLARYLDPRETMSDLAFYPERAELPLLRVILLPFPALLLLAAIGFVSDRRERPSHPGRDAVALAILASLVVCLVFFVHGRYRATGVVAALLLAPRGAQALATLLRSPGFRRASAVAVSAAVAGTIVWAQGLAEGPRERALAQLNAGLAYERLGDEAEAFAQFAPAFESAPNDPAVRNSYARSLAATGRRQEAEAILEQGLAAEPAAVELRVSLGWLQFQEGRAADAEGQFLEALRREPTSLSAKLSLTFMLQQRAGDRSALVAVAERFREVADANHPAYTRPALLGLGMTYGSLGERDRIDPTFERLARLKPLSSIEESEWGLALHQAGRYADARPHHARAVELDPRNAIAYYRLALTEQALEDSDAARSHFEKARSLGFSPGP